MLDAGVWDGIQPGGTWKEKRAVPGSIITYVVCSGCDRRYSTKELNGTKPRVGWIVGI